jgi:hypothetical protein
MSEAINPSYEDIREKAKGPGVEEWRCVDKTRADLSGLYRNLSEDERYAPEYKAETAWTKYEETKAEVEKLAPEARQKMLKSAEGLERLSIPTPEGEGLITKDTNKLLLTAHERSRIEGLISAIARGAADRRWCTRWEVDHGLRWDKECQVWVARDGFAYAWPEERTTREVHA